MDRRSRFHEYTPSQSIHRFTLSPSAANPAIRYRANQTAPKVHRHGARCLRGFPITGWTNQKRSAGKRFIHCMRDRFSGCCNKRRSKTMSSAKMHFCCIFAELIVKGHVTPIQHWIGSGVSYNNPYGPLQSRPAAAVRDTQRRASAARYILRTTELEMQISGTVGGPGSAERNDQGHLSLICCRVTSPDHPERQELSAAFRKKDRAHQKCRRGL